METQFRIAVKFCILVCKLSYSRNVVNPVSLWKREFNTEGPDFDPLSANTEIWLQSQQRGPDSGPKCVYKFEFTLALKIHHHRR